MSWIICKYCRNVFWNNGHVCHISSLSMFHHLYIHLCTQFLFLGNSLRATWQKYKHRSDFMFAIDNKRHLVIFTPESASCHPFQEHFNRCLMWNMIYSFMFSTTAPLRKDESSSRPAGDSWGCILKSHSLPLWASGTWLNPLRGRILKDEWEKHPEATLNSLSLSLSPVCLAGFPPMAAVRERWQY